MNLSSGSFPHQRQMPMLSVHKTRHQADELDGIAANPNFA